MDRLSKKEEITLLKVEKQRAIISKYLFNGLITDKDIISLVNVKSDYGITYDINEISEKEKVLKLIYNFPYLLCDQKKLSLEVKKILPLFLHCRYNMEKDEIEYLYNLGEYSKKEYKDIIKMLRFIYYKTSKDGKEILKTGHAKKIKDNTYQLCYKK